MAQLPIAMEPDGGSGIRSTQGTTTISAQFDGKEYPVKPDTTWKTASVKRIDPNTIEFSLKGASGAVMTRRIAISADGRQMTFTTKTVNATGGKDNSEYKYRRQ